MCVQERLVLRRCLQLFENRPLKTIWKNGWCECIGIDYHFGGAIYGGIYDGFETDPLLRRATQHWILEKEVVVCGWVQRQRDLGQLIFIDLRDRTGIVQLAFDEGTDRAIFEKGFAARAEFVLLARGNCARAYLKKPGAAHRRH